MGAGLTGLTTAFRLASHGCQVSIVDQGQDQPSLASTSPDSHNIHSETRPPLHPSPLVIHGFQHATWALMRELQTDALLMASPPVPLEFLSGRAHHPTPFNPGWAPPPLHTLIGLLRFQGIPFAERWTLVKRLEQYWEGDLELPQDLESQSANAWLSTLGQSKHTINTIWDALCQFFLGSDTHHTSAHYFKAFLAHYFLSTRQDHRTLIPSFNENTLLFAPLRNALISHDVSMHNHSPISYFHYDAAGLSGVILNDGTRLTADYYISALPRHTLIACLSDRLLTKYAYFSNLTKLHEQSLLVIHIEIPTLCPKPRLWLLANTFNWMTVRPVRQTPEHTSHSTLLSCVKTSELSLAEITDQDILAEVSNLLPASITPHLHQSESIRMARTMRTYVTCHPDTAVFRPIQKSPLSNLFVAGPWTDTGSPASHESSILSATLCTQAVLDSIACR